MADAIRKPWANQAQAREKTRMVTFRLPVRLTADLDRIASQNKTTKTAIVKYLAEQFVAEQRAPEKPVRTELFP